MQIVAWSLINQTEQIYFEKSEFKGYHKTLFKGLKNDLKKKWENRGQKLSQLYHLQFDAAETCQSRPLELPDYCE